MKKVAIFEKFIKIKEIILLVDLIERFRNGTYGYLIKPLRQKLNSGDKKGYDNDKRYLYAVTFSALFEGGRTLKHLIFYSGLIVLDIDHLTLAMLVSLREIIINIDYTMACFVSPSGLGLKILVQVSTGLKEHIGTFNRLASFYEDKLGVGVDRSGRDVTRLCYVTVDYDLYYNPTARIFDPGELDGKTCLVIPPDDPRLKMVEACVPDDSEKKKPDPLKNVRVNEEKGQTQGPSVIKDIPSEMIGKLYRRCIVYIERKYTFMEGERNIFVFQLALMMRRAGIPEDKTAMLLHKDYNYDEREVTNCVKSAFAYNWTAEATEYNETGHSYDLPKVVNQVEPSLKADGFPVTDKGLRKGGSTHIQDVVPVKAIAPATTAAAIKPVHGEEITAEEYVQGTPAEYPDTVATTPSASTLSQEKLKRKGREQYDIVTVQKILSSRYEFRYNEVTGMTEYRKKVKCLPYIRLEDYDENSLFLMLLEEGQLIPLHTLHALLNSDFSPSFNVFKAYARGLKKWDNVTDYIGQLCATVTTSDPEYWSFCFRKWFVAFAVSLINDQIFNHTVIVFVGAQGIGKTSWMKLILPQPLKNHMGTATLHSDFKDTSIQLSECALILLDELESLNRKDLSELKEMVTRSEIRVRRPYGRNPQNLIRRASWMGAVNHGKVLTDTTGSRRFLCFNVTNIDYMHHVDIDGCFAQAYALYHSGFQYWFDQEQISELNDHNENYLSKSVVEELIQIWMRTVTRAEWDNRKIYVNDQNIKAMTSTQIAAFLIEKARFNLTDAIVVQVGKIMSKMEFEYLKKNNNHFYLVRILDGEAVERAMDQTEKVVAMSQEQKDNEQIINLEEDMANLYTKDELPF